jgi:hypothetical protein
MRTTTIKLKIISGIDIDIYNTTNMPLIRRCDSDISSSLGGKLLITLNLFLHKKEHKTQNDLNHVLL